MSRASCSPSWPRSFFAPYPDTIVAVTGTNGKTSTVELTRQLWRMAGHRSASIGTLGVTTADDQVKTGLTTPDIVTFLSNMAGMKRMGISHVAYEASSHGLDQYRAEGRAGEGGGLHQFQPRPSRLSSRHGRLFRGQDAAVRRGGRGGRDGGGVDRRCQVAGGDRPCAAARAEADHRRAGGGDDRAGVARIDPARPAAGAAP